MTRTRNSLGAANVREYLTALLLRLALASDDTSVERVTGVYGWKSEVHAALVRADLVSGEVDECERVVWCDEYGGDLVIMLAISKLGAER